MKTLENGPLRGALWIVEDANSLFFKFYYYEFSLLAAITFSYWIRRYRRKKNAWQRMAHVCVCVCMCMCVKEWHWEKQGVASWIIMGNNTALCCFALIVLLLGKCESQRCPSGLEEDGGVVCCCAVFPWQCSKELQVGKI